MFAFVLHDLDNIITFGARDRFGIKPFFYVYDNSQFSFSSEVKGLIPIIGKLEPNYEIITDYLYDINFEEKGDCFFKNVKQLLPGQLFVVKESGLEINDY
jgi:asparagine synthase (glutamine-hydrolysing)